MEPRERFGENLRSERKRRAFSQEDLAHECGLHPTEVSRLERGERDPQLATIVKVAKGLGVPAARLVKGL